MDFVVANVGPCPFIGSFCQEFDVVNSINARLDWKGKPGEVSPGILIKSLIIRLLHGSTILCHHDGFFRKKDTELLFGAGIKAENITDAAMAQALEAMHRVGCRDIVSDIMVKGAVKEGMDLSEIHSHTSSRMTFKEYIEEEHGFFFGTYEFPWNEGHDRFYHLLNSKEGVPIYGYVSKKPIKIEAWNEQALNIFKNLEKESVPSDLVYATDSVDESFLNKAHEQGIGFVSRLPQNSSLAGNLIDRALDLAHWEEIESVPGHPNSPSYKLWETQDVLGGRTYRFVVVHASRVDKRKLRALKNRVAKEEKELLKVCAEAMDEMYSSEQAALEALHTLQTQHAASFFTLHGAVHTVEDQEVLERGGAMYRIEVSPGSVREDVFDREVARISSFALIISGDDRSCGEILASYKRQNDKFNLFKFVRGSLYLDPCLMKDEKYVEVISNILLLALFIYKIIEKRVRRALETEKTPLIIGGGVETYRPTGRRVLELLDYVMLVIENPSGEKMRYLDKGGKDIKRVLKLAGCDLSIYTTPPEQ